MLLARPSCIDTQSTQDQNGMTPLIEAVKNGHYDVVKTLLDKGMHSPPLLYQFLTPFS